MKIPAAASRLVFKPKRYTSVVMMLIIWAGVAGCLFTAISSDLHNKEFMRGNAQTIAQSIPISEITKLKGNNSDLNAPAYQDIKNLLTKIHTNNTDLRFVYLMGIRRAGEVYYYADSESPGSDTYLPPGQVYVGAPVRLINAFSGAEEGYVQGLRRNYNGLWITSIAPVVDEHNGRVVALVGVDRSAVNYYSQLFVVSVVPLLLAAIPLAGLIRDRRLEAKQHEITQLKNQFVSIASHELRSPLTGMLWAIQSLLKNSEEMTKQQQTLLNDMFRSAEASLATVNEILDLSIFERGQANKLQQEIVDLCLVLKEVCATLKLGAKEKHITFKFEHLPDHAYVTGDVAALKRAYMNIIANAIKYTKSHSDVAISYRLANHEHIISIKDDGIGIPLKEQSKVMEGYYRATNAVNVQAHGTGLGLWVTRMVIEQHKGRLWLNSRINHGTTIFTALPLTSSSLEKTDS